MFYDPLENLRPAPLTHNPFNALVAPRPIGWISTVSRNGVINLAPFSYFNGVSADPPCVMFAPNARNKESIPKDTYQNILEVPEFVANLATWESREAMNLSSKDFPPEVNEFDEIGLTAVPCEKVRPPRVGEAKVSLECRVTNVVTLPRGGDGRSSHVVIGQVVGIHIDDDVIVDGVVQEARLQPIARLGASNYVVVREVFEMRRPS